MKNLYLILFLVSSTFGFGQNAGFFGTPLSSIIYNDENPQDQTADVFSGSDLGLITNLVLNGARMQTFKNGGADVTGAFIHYRVYEQGNTPPAFTQQNINFAANLGGGDQRWEQSNLNIDILSGLSGGDYTFEVFFRITVTGCCGNEVFQSNSGSNYSADFSLPYNTAASGNWDVSGTWDGGIIPPSNANVVILHNVALNTDATVSSIEITSGNTFTGSDGSARTLTIEDTGTFTNNGTFTANDGTVSFAGSGTVSGTTTFNNVDIGGGVNFGTGSTISGNLTVNAGGFAQTNSPIYGGSSTLTFSTGGPYVIATNNTLWTQGSTVGSGVPFNVTVATSTLEISESRDVTGTLTISSGASLSTTGGADLFIDDGLTNNGTINQNGLVDVGGNFTNTFDYNNISDSSGIGVSPGELLIVRGNFDNQLGATFDLSSQVGGDLEVQGNFDDSGTFSANSRAVFFTGGNAQTVTSSTDPLVIDFLLIDKTLNDVVMNQNLDLPNNLTLTSGNLNLSSNTLSISGDIISTGGSIIANGPGSTLVFDDALTARIIEAGDLQNNEVTNLTFDESAGVTIDTDLKVGGIFDINVGAHSISSTSVLDITGGSLDVALGAGLTFKSDANGTAQLETIDQPTTINGDITVERFIPAGTNTRRAYRLLTSAVNSIGTIKDNWQEGVNNSGTNFPTDNQNPEPGFGIHITGGSALDGFDQTETNNPSMFTFDNSFPANQPGQTQNDAWSVIPNTNVTQLEAGKPYLTFVRGDRGINVTINGATPTNTTLRATGTLETGNQTSQVLSSVGEFFSLLGNPYQAIVDFNDITFSGDVNTNNLYVWNPNLNTRGGYETITIAANQMIQPGQSFWVQNSQTVSIPPTVEFTEAAKETTGIVTTVFDDVDITRANLSLYNSDNLKLDVLQLSFEDNANNGLDDFDGGKLANPDENLASWSNSSILSVERRATPQNTDVIQLSTTNYRFLNYEFRLNTSNWNPNLQVFVVDNYLDTTTEINDQNPFNFTVDLNIPESIAEDRFNIVFDNTTLGVNDSPFGTGFFLYPNPSTNGQFSIKTPNLSGEVNVEISNLLGQQVSNQNLFIESQQVKVNALNLSAGVYVVKLSQGNQSYSSKLIVK